MIAYQTSVAPAILAPPIPPNPEKDAILSALSSTLRANLDNTIHENLSAITPLFAQDEALKEAHARLQTEMNQLSEIETAIASNEKILRDTTIEADRIMTSAKQRTAPEVDSVLVTPTAVGTQLYDLCAEEVAIREAIFVLTRALDYGRIETDVFVKVSMPIYFL